ncbi:LEAF RUST 10 DISEASE-RESISTANCE LOCUS RECEPTOR-LIKE PROTEIN KINASE-like 2.4 isoform X1 [Vicia villosa]|uniref:LEAF RUST 10 DISEASE-RESISTANCE LOCUS RECEPTOR-LIKE PROTEIN KINASE-like 2.4 isoform X1 n=1 Tax=Vicia villosa TaxID=3911 RepID=UPI00273AC41C|nr:LEAF RUST 10 DISEASE-RESISTANCE LOCUS RECEPTOR-LIKE PROTEIN KINASE-like 2.4 isoform X1 [Vicia villosa]
MNLIFPLNIISSSSLSYFLLCSKRMDNHINSLMPINFRYIFFFLLLIISTFCSQLSYSQSQPQSIYDYSICRDLNHSYNCGNLSYISYPFWGQNRPIQCGAGKPFQLHCHNNQDTTIQLSYQNFTVIEINTNHHIIKLKRTDLSQNLCSPQFDHIYLTPTLFQYADTYLSPTLVQYLPQVKNITIYYNCDPSPYFPKVSLCGAQNYAFCPVGDYANKFLEVSRNCRQYIQVPVGGDFPIENGSYYYLSREVLEKGLDKGFEVKYSVNEECLQCLGYQEGGCVSDDFDKHATSTCYYHDCPDGSIAFSSQCSSDQKSKQVSWHGKMKTILGIGSAIMVALLMCVIFCCIRGKRSIQQVNFWYKTKNDKNIEAFFKENGALTQKKYKFSEIKKMTNSFEIKLGQGGFGVVYKGKLFNGCLVAVKILNASKRNGEDFINEIASITRTSHVNIVTLLGFCFEGRKKALVYEFMSNGSLDKFIYNKGPETIISVSWDNLYQIAKGIARGLEYLHRGCTTRILHFDIKPHNILLDENFSPKISDFGLAKLCPKKESIISMSDQRGTMGYVAPEVWNRHFGGVSHKSDVYSYGMMLLEMVGGRKNINADASHTSEIYFPHWVYNKLEFGSDLRPDIVMDTEEDEIARKMTIVGLWCIQIFPNDRPTMSKVVEMLEVSTSSLEIPPMPLLSSPIRPVSES